MHQMTITSGLTEEDYEDALWIWILEEGVTVQVYSSDSSFSIIGEPIGSGFGVTNYLSNGMSDNFFIVNTATEA